MIITCGNTCSMNEMHIAFMIMILGISLVAIKAIQIFIRGRWYDKCHKSHEYDLKPFDLTRGRMKSIN